MPVIAHPTIVFREVHVFLLNPVSFTQTKILKRKKMQGLLVRPMVSHKMALPGEWGIRKIYSVAFFSSLLLSPPLYFKLNKAPLHKQFVQRYTGHEYI